MNACDLVVVGAGPAGLSCAMAAAQAGMTVVVFESAAAGGQLLNIPEVLDYPGFPKGVPGWDLAAHFLDHAVDCGAALQFEQVEPLQRTSNGWQVVGSFGAATVAQAVVLASGSEEDLAHVPGAEAMVGRGVSLCAGCDAPLYRDKVVAVVGNGDVAFSEAWFAAQYAEQVVVLLDEAQSTSRRSAWRQRAESCENVLFRVGVPSAVLGDTVVTGLRYVPPTGVTADLATDGVFLAGPRRPRNAVFEQALTSQGGAIAVDQSLQCGRRGLFAAGDVRAGSTASIASAVADGHRAAAAVLAFLEESQHV